MSPVDFKAPTILFGGTFDPIHEGHLHVAQAVRATMPLGTQLAFVPAWHSPGKPPAVASPSSRLAWARLAAEPLGFPVWDAEIKRGGPESYTVDTLEEAHRSGAAQDGLWWLMGADAYKSFSRWKNPQRIRGLCRLLVVSRPAESLASQDPSDRVLEIPPHPASSTRIREGLAQGQLNQEWLPPPVRQALSELLPDQNPYARTLE